MNLDHIASASSQSIHEKTTSQATPLKNYGDGTLFKMDCIFWNKAENIRLKSKGSLIDTATQSRCQLLCKIKFMVGDLFVCDARCNMPWKQLMLRLL